MTDNPAYHATYPGPCPRCGGGVPNDAQRGLYPGALSRLDDRTYICSQCGQQEALYQFFQYKRGLSTVLPPFDEPLVVNA